MFGKGIRFPHEYHYYYSTEQPTGCSLYGLALIIEYISGGFPYEISAEERAETNKLIPGYPQKVADSCHHLVETNGAWKNRWVRKRSFKPLSKVVCTLQSASCGGFAWAPLEEHLR